MSVAAPPGAPDVSVVLTRPAPALVTALARQTLRAHEVVDSFEQARGAWVLFAGDDLPLERHALKNLLLAAEQCSAEVAIGEVRPPLHPQVVDEASREQLGSEGEVRADTLLLRRAWLADHAPLLDLLARGADRIPASALRAAVRIVTVPELIHALQASPTAASSGGRLARDLPALAFFIARLLPARAEVVFDVQGGRAVDTALVGLMQQWQQQRPRTRHRWIERGERGRWRHAWHLGRARWLVCNEVFLTRLPKRSGQRMLVAGIELPLLRSGRDNPDWVLQPTSERRPAWSQVGRWDLAVAPSAFAEQVLRSSTAYVGEVVTGSVFGDAVAAAAADVGLRARLGIQAPERVVLIALASATRAPDLREVRACLPAGVRLVAVTDDGSRLPLVPEVVQLDADIAAWCAAADLLITDWSALTLEFARLQRPCIAFQVDGPALERRRGTYLDLPALLPGPVVDSVASLEEVLRAWADGGAEAIGHDAERSAALAQAAGPADGGTADRLWQALAGGR